VCGVVEEKNKSNKKKEERDEDKCRAIGRKESLVAQPLQIHDGINGLLPSP